MVKVSAHCSYWTRDNSRFMCWKCYSPLLEYDDEAFFARMHYLDLTKWARWFEFSMLLEDNNCFHIRGNEIFKTYERWLFKSSYHHWLKTFKRYGGVMENLIEPEKIWQACPSYPEAIAASSKRNKVKP